MAYLIAAVITAAIGVLPLAFSKGKGSAGFVGLATFAITWLLYYLLVPSMAWPLYGLMGFCAIAGFCISSVLAITTEGASGWWGVASAVLAFLFVSTLFLGAGMFNAASYAQMIGPVAERDWTTDIQPKDPKHMLMVTQENALYLAQKAVGSAGPIGSQFSLETDYMTLQKVNGRLVYVAPFDFNGFFTWLNAKGSPGYIIIDAQDPEAQPQLVTNKGLMHFMPGAFFGSNLKRYIRQNGYLDQALADPLFEVDEQGNPFWIVPLYKPTIEWSGKKITGVLVVNPMTGAITRYSLETVPAWVDRVIPGDFVKDYLSWRGDLSGGWLNSMFGAIGLTQPEEPLLIYGSNNRAEWVVGITSQSGKDDSLIDIVFVDSRSGKAVSYRVPGGATESAIENAVDANKDVSYRKLHASSPQIYNVYGTMAAVVPLLNENDGFQGVAVVSIKDVQDVAVGTTESEALRNYQALIFRRGEQISVNGSSSLTTVTGTIDRIRQDVGSNTSPYYLHLAGTPRIFTASSQDYPTLPLTEPGDIITVKFVASGEQVVPVQLFENASLPLENTKAQEQVTQTALTRQNAEMQTAGDEDLRKRVLALSPAQLRMLMAGSKQPNH